MEGENKEFALNLRLIFRKNNLKIWKLIPLKRKKKKEIHVHTTTLECCFTQIEDCSFGRFL